jgi:hypothetical protein
MIVDCDGTIIGPSQEISPAVKEALRKAAKFTRVSFCTGRPATWVLSLARELGLTTAHIVEAGARVVDSNGVALWQKLIPAAMLHDLWSRASNLELRVGAQINGAEVDMWTPNETDVAVSHLYCRHNDRARIEGFIEDIKHDLPTVHPILSHFQFDNKPITWIADITADGANKQHGLMHLARIEHIDLKKTMAVGDGYNDFPLFLACGFRVAMGNAPPELKAIANFVAPHIDDDGLVDVIERFVL